MNHGAMRKLMRVATLSLLVVTTASGVAGFEVLAAGPAMALPGDPVPPNPDPNAPNPDPDRQGTPGGSGGLLDGLLGGGGSGGGSGSGGPLS